MLRHLSLLSFFFNLHYACGKSQSFDAREKHYPTHQTEIIPVEEGYLYSLAEAQMLGEPVLPLEKSNMSKTLPEADMDYQSKTDYLTEFSNKGFNIQSLSPWRDFSFVIYSADIINAEAFEQNILLPTATIENLYPMELLFTVCHEMAHSTRNHQVEIEKFKDLLSERESTDIGEELKEAIKTYLNKHYDKTTRTFSQSTSDFIILRSLWKKF